MPRSPHVRGRQRSRRARSAASLGALIILTGLLDLGPMATSSVRSDIGSDADQGRRFATPLPLPTSMTDTSRDTAERSSPSGPSMERTLPASNPVRLHIPAIGVDSSLIALGLQADGTLEVPPGATPAGWFTGGPTPGEQGPAVLVGHVNWGGRPGVFVDLWRVTAGDEVAVQRADGSTATFQVASVLQVAKQDFPTSTVYGDLEHAGLRLITCGGRFDRTTGSYEDNIIVLAELARIDR